MAVRIPISADASAVTQQLDRIRDAIRRAGQEGRAFKDLDLSHPELKTFASDIARITENLERLTTTARGATAATARQLYDGSGANLFGPNGLFERERWHQRQSDPRTADRLHENALRYVSQGTSFAFPPSFPAETGHGSGQPPNAGGGGGAADGGGGGGWGASAMGMARGYLPAMLAMAGIRGITSMVAEGVRSAGEEAQANDRLLRTLRDLGPGFEDLRDRVRDATRGLALTYTEAQQLVGTYARQSSDPDAGRVTGGMRFWASLARSYGMDPATMVRGGGQMAFLGGNDERRFAGILISAIQSSGLTGRPGEVMETMLRFQDANARRFGDSESVERFMAAYAALSSSGVPGVRGAGAERLLNTADRALQQGGGAGEASQYLTYRALSDGGVTDIFAQRRIRERGMLGALPNGQTYLSAVINRLRREYGHLPTDQFEDAVANHFSTTMDGARQLLGLDGNIRRIGGGNAFSAGLQAAGIDTTNLNPTAANELAQIMQPGANLDEWRRTILGRLPAGPSQQRSAIEGASGEDLRTLLLRAVNQLGRPETIGSKYERSVAEFTNELTKQGARLLPALTGLRDAATGLSRGVDDLASVIRDGVLALFGDEEAAARLQTRRTIMMPGASGPTPGSITAAGSLAPPTGDAAATADEMERLLRAGGLDDDEIAGVMAQAQHESRFRPNALVRDSNGLMSGGLFQWNGPRRDAFRAWSTAALGRTIYPEEATTEEQVRFFLHERGGSERSNIEAARRARMNGQPSGAAPTADDWAYIYGTGYERHGGGDTENGARMSTAIAIQNRMRARRGGAQQGAAPANGGAAETRERPPRSRQSPSGAVRVIPDAPPGVAGTPAPDGGPATRSLDDVLRDVPGQIPGNQSSLGFRPLRVIVEDTRGNMLGEHFLALEPPTGGGAPVPWGIG